MRELFRCIHTIKGLSAMVGIEPVVVLAHRMETSLRLADRAGGGLTVASVDALLAGVRAVGHRVRALADGKAVPEAPASLLERLDRRVDTIEPQGAFGSQPELRAGCHAGRQAFCRRT